MESKKPKVSDEEKAAAAKRAAAAKKAAEAKKAAGTTRKAPAAERKDVPEKKAAPKKKAPVKEVAEEAEEAAAVEDEVAEEPEKEVRKPKLEKAVTDDERKSVKSLRTTAIILWVLAVASEVGAFFAFSWAVRINALYFGSQEVWFLIGALVLDAIFCIVAAQLWKKSNRISPCLADSKLVRTIWHQLGVILVLVCFLPIGIFLLLKSDKMDKKTKTILLAIVAALFVGATTASVDYKQPSQEEVEQLQQEAIAENGGGEVYWTRYGKSYHFDRDCQHIRGKALVEDGGTLSQGTLDDAFAANRWDPCDACAGGAEAKADEAAPTEDTAEELEPAA